MHILSFDCANRSLAVCFITLNEHVERDILTSYNKKDAAAVIFLINNYIKIHMLKVYDLTEGIKRTTVERAALLKRCLSRLDFAGLTPDNILVEYQMSANDKSRCVSNQIVYHFTDMFEHAKIYLVGPTLKNKIAFKKDLNHGVFMAKYASKYTANKNHTKSNFLYWLEIHNLNHLIKINKIAKKNIDDIADAFMQIFGWIDHAKKK